MPVEKKLRQAGNRTERIVESFGSGLVRFFHLLGLFVIGATIFWSAVAFYLELIKAGHASLHDILLLFIYIELGAMVGIYFHTEQLPVEFLLYIAITVITRTLVSFEELSEIRVVVATLSVLVLAIAVFLLRWGAHKFTTNASAGARATDLPD
ncbi:MAG: phosphate-starvation-inducible PsiE family protein [Gammaproteobacteria bacterium]